MAAFVKRVFPEKFLANLDRRLESTKIALTAEEYVGITMLATIVLCVAVGFIGVLLRLPIPPLLLVPFVAVVAFPALTLFVPRYLAQRRAAELERMLPDVLRQMASTLRAGVGIDATLDDIVKSKYGALSDEFDRVVTEIKKGRTLESALLALARRSNSPLYERAFRLIVEGIERGAALASVLDAVAGDIKEVHAIQRERKSTTTQQVMFLYAVALFAVPFIVGLTVGVGGISIGAGPVTGGGGLPPEMSTIAMAYIIIQAFICGLAVGVIRYGQMSKGLGYSIPFMVAGVIVFFLAQTIIRGMAPATV
ncbi:MAG: type II secretion system F family protein [Candidatus Hodarchaeaceae archaeon]|nr:type II secretion system F family protein [Candidatus Hodarchaeaceae archaeon]